MASIYRVGNGGSCGIIGKYVPGFHGRMDGVTDSDDGDAIENLMWVL